MSAIRSYVNCLHELHLQIDSLSFEVEKLTIENERLKNTTLPAVNYLLHGRQSLFVYLLEIMEEQIATDEATIREIMMQLLYIQQDK